MGRRGKIGPVGRWATESEGLLPVRSLVTTEARSEQEGSCLKHPHLKSTLDPNPLSDSHLTDGETARRPEVAYLR